jgi:hypothetical protein
MAVIVGNCVEMKMESFHLHLHTITHDHGHVKLPSVSQHNYPQSQLCHASISISTQLPKLDIALIVGNCVEMEMEV